MKHLIFFIYLYLFKGFFKNQFVNIFIVIFIISPIGLLAEDVPEKVPEKAPEKMESIVAKTIVASKGGRGEKILIQWVKDDNVKKYIIFRSIGDQKHFEKIAVTEDNSYEDLHNQKGKLLFYRVKALNVDELDDELDDELLEDLYDNFEDNKSYKGLYTRSIVPGWGQFYSDHPTRGFIYSIGFGVSSLTMIGMLIYSNYTKNKYNEGTSDFDDLWSSHETAVYVTWTFAGLATAFYIANWVDVLFFNKDFNPDYEVEVQAFNDLNPVGINFYAGSKTGKDMDRLNFELTKRF